MKTLFTSPIEISVTANTVGETPDDKAWISINYRSKYATGGSHGFTKDNIPDIIKEIEDLCGKGSYCLYSRDNKTAYGSPEYIPYLKSRHINYPKITYWQQGIKTDVIEIVRKVMETAFGDIPETKIGWLEDQCRSYIEDLPEEERRKAD